MPSLLSSLGGTRSGSFFNYVPSYVDISQKPGCSQLPRPTFTTWITSIPYLLITTPNLIWAIIALLTYYLFPYDLTQKHITWGLVIQRTAIWFTIVFCYDLFWHITLYHLNWSKRPFISHRTYRLDRIIHNVFWTCMGIMIWVAFELVFIYLWSNHKLSYMSDTEMRSSSWGIFNFIVSLCLIPVWRDFHFYFAHRFLHQKSMYVHVHSLHHRNTDIEPFAGLSMHPIEHIYYYSCIFPSLLFYCSPFAFLWNGMHLLLAPGASHSGWEDHWQADAFHYMHHRYFECNYAGYGASFLDVYFNTFTPSMAHEKEIKSRADVKATLKAAPTQAFIIYIVLAMICVIGPIIVAAYVHHVSWGMRLFLAISAGFGPVWIAQSMTSGSISTALSSITTDTIIHTVTGYLFSAVPISMAVYALF